MTLSKLVGPMISQVYTKFEYSGLRVSDSDTQILISEDADQSNPTDFNYISYYLEEMKLKA